MLQLLRALAERSRGRVLRGGVPVVELPPHVVVIDGERMVVRRIVSISDDAVVYVDLAGRVRVLQRRKRGLGEARERGLEEAARL